MLVAIISAKGAPGVTSTALAMAIHWPRPVFVLEADLSGSSIIAGYHQGAYAHDRGVVPLAMAHNAGALSIQEVENQTIALDSAGKARLIPGIVTAAKAPAAREIWGPLASELAAYDSTDTIVDVGRFNASRDDRDAVLAVADLVLVATSSRLADVWTTRQLVTARLAHTPDTSHQLTNMRALTVGPGRPYDADYVAQSIGLRSAGEVLWDPKTAAVYSDGARPPLKYAKSKFAKSLDELTANVERQITDRRAQLQGAAR